MDWTQIGMTAVTTLVAVIATVGLRLMSLYIKDKKMKNIESAALDALLEGMALAQDTVIRPEKKDGKKLSSLIIEKAECVAVDKAKSVAKGAALDMIKSWTTDTTKAKIKGLLKWGNTVK